MNYYAVIDTNVLVSAMLKRNSVPRNVMGERSENVTAPASLIKTCECGKMLQGL